MRVHACARERITQDDKRSVTTYVSNVYDVGVIVHAYARRRNA